MSLRDTETSFEFRTLSEAKSCLISSDAGCTYIMFVQCDVPPPVKVSSLKSSSLMMAIIGFPSAIFIWVCGRKLQVVHSPSIIEKQDICIVDTDTIFMEGVYQLLVFSEPMYSHAQVYTACCPAASDLLCQKRSQ